jgi:DNA repair protein RadC
MWTLIILLVIVICIIWYNQTQASRYRKICGDAQALKQRVPAEGGFFQSPYSSRRDFLDYIGQFLKYKKHEWIFVAFMKGNLVDRFWVNKGPDNQRVGPVIGIPGAARICGENGYNGVLVGHNHPAGALAPSKQDRVFLEEFMDSLAQQHVSVEHLVFVGGRWRNYGLSVGQHIRRIFTGPRQA